LTVWVDRLVVVVVVSPAEERAARLHARPVPRRTRCGFVVEVGSVAT